MTFHVEKHPLDWYVSKISRGEPFSSILYGDGEFYVAMGSRTGSRMAYGEVVTKGMEGEMADALRDDSSDVLWGTDENLLNYMEYRGRNPEGIHQIGKRITEFLRGFPDKQWVDGVVWDSSVRAGTLGPFLKIIRDKKCVLIGNTSLLDGMHEILGCDRVAVPGNNAFAEIDSIERQVSDIVLRTGDRVCVFCMGLGTTPLIMRLRKRPEFGGSVLMDLGSVLDVFVRGSPERGWRDELYTGPTENYNALIESNLKELQC